jgi:pimeloyl-ACP methyl ester carboxylesterase
VANATLQTIEVQGVKGCIAEAGTGPTIVLLVSPFARASMYQPTIEELAKRFRVIAVEMPGCGCAARLKHPWDFGEYARWVAALIEALGLDDVVLIGHSHTGAVALRVGAAHAERIAGLVVADSVGAGGRRSILAVLVGCAMCVPFEVRFVLRGSLRLARNLLRHGRNFLVQFWRAVRADVRPVAQDVKRPVLLAWGARDFVMPVAGARELANVLPNAQLYVSQRGSHDWLIERAEEFAVMVERFATRVQAGAAAPAVTQLPAA